ncbi:MAG: calcium-binding protein, partial [Pseudomonadota bacterium]
MTWIGTFAGNTTNLIGGADRTGIAGIQGYFGTLDINQGLNVSAPSVVFSSPTTIIMQDPEFLGEIRFIGTGLTFVNQQLPGGLGTIPRLTGGTITQIEFLFNTRLDSVLTQLATAQAGAPGVPPVSQAGIDLLLEQQALFSDPQFLEPNASIAVPNINAAQLGTAVVQSYSNANPAALQGFFDQFNFNFSGNEFINNLRGSSNNDFLFGAGGDDILEGGTGNDTLDGGNGNDQLNGGAGSDLYLGSNGADAFNDDVLNRTDRDAVSYVNANRGATIVLDSSSGRQNDGAALGDTYLGIEVAIGTQFNDTIFGRGLPTVDFDTLIGLGGDDELFSGEGQDVLIGGAGFDFLDGGVGGGLVFGPAVFDTAVYEISPNDIHFFLDQFNRLLVAAPGVRSEGLDTLVNIDVLEIGGQTFGLNQLTLSSANLVVGNINGGQVSGTSANDVAMGRDGDDIISTFGGFDTLDGARGNDTLSGGADGDRIFGGVGNDVLNGDDGEDVIFGGDGSDRLNGGAQNDILIGGFGPDVLNGGGGADLASYSDAGAGVLVSLKRGIGKFSTAEGDTFASVENLSGSGFDDRLIAD